MVGGQKEGRGEGVGTLDIPGRSRMIPASGGSRQLLREQPEYGGVDSPQPGPLLKYLALRIERIIKVGLLKTSQQIRHVVGMLLFLFENAFH